MSWRITLGARSSSFFRGYGARITEQTRTMMLITSSGAGNIHVSGGGEGESRGRDAHKGPGGMLGNVMRSLSRAKGGERRKD